MEIATFANAAALPAVFKASFGKGPKNCGLQEWNVTEVAMVVSLVSSSSPCASSTAVFASFIACTSFRTLLSNVSAAELTAPRPSQRSPSSRPHH